MDDITLTTPNSAMFNPHILMPIPDHDFDPTEASIPWMACNSRGWSVVISTENGNVPEADSNKLHGPLPGLLTASKKARVAYQKMTQDPYYQHPIRYAEINPGDYHALLLPGGDGLRMRQYLESVVLQDKVLQFWQQGKLIGAICHGILVMARTINPETQRSVLYGYKVTAPPKSLDRFAYHIDKWLIRHGYIMYPSCVEDEVRACLQYPEDLSAGPGILSPYVVSHENLITTRTYMDAEAFAERFTNELQQRMHD
jgi:putative intracellular protease/amidase